MGNFNNVLSFTAMKLKRLSQEILNFVMIYMIYIGIDSVVVYSDLQISHLTGKKIEIKLQLLSWQTNTHFTDLYSTIKTF